MLSIVSTKQTISKNMTRYVKDQRVRENPPERAVMEEERCCVRVEPVSAVTKAENPW